MATKKVPVLEEFAWQPPVKDKDLSSPPGSPSKGHRYIVAATGSGDWTDHTGDIAEYNGSSWIFVTKTEGLVTWVEDEDILYKYDGSNWVIEGCIVQVVPYQTGSVATGTTVIPIDDTIPQNTEGDQYMSLSVTPKNSNNKLLIEVVAHAVHSVSGAEVVALFQDDIADALAVGLLSNYYTAWPQHAKLTCYMTAGTTNQITFKVRIGSNASGTTTFNGAGSSRLFGGKMISSIVITEYRG